MMMSDEFNQNYVDRGRVSMVCVCVLRKCFQSAQVKFNVAKLAEFPLKIF